MTAGRQETPEELERRILLAVLGAQDEFPDDDLDISVAEWKEQIRGRTAAPATSGDAPDDAPGATVLAFPTLRPAGTMNRAARAASTHDAQLSREVSTISDEDGITITASDVGSSAALLVVEVRRVAAEPHSVIVLQVGEPGRAAELFAAVLEPHGELLVGTATVTSSAAELTVSRSAPLPVTELSAELVALALDTASDDALDAWRDQVSALPADHPVRVAVEDPPAR
jgi:hypothetical protein